MKRPDKRPCAVALGMFDGLHAGHRAVIERTVALARDKGWQSVAYTFSNHPRGVFAQAPKLLMTPEEKRAGLEAMGIARVDMVVFDAALAGLSPEAFLQALANRYDLKALVYGEDYTFGKGGSGNAQTLAQMAPRFGYEAIEVPFVTLEGEKISSTRVRKALEAGDLELVHRMTQG